MIRKSAIRSTFTAVIMALTVGAVSAQEDVAPTPGTPLKLGDILSGRLDAMHVRGRKGDAFQLTSEPHRLPPPHQYCDLLTGPQTFELVTRNDAETAQLRALVGHAVSVRIDEIGCADAVGQMSEAVISQWRIVKGTAVVPPRPHATTQQPPRAAAQQPPRAAAQQPPRPAAPSRPRAAARHPKGPLVLTPPPRTLRAQ